MLKALKRYRSIVLCGLLLSSAFHSAMSEYLDQARITSLSNVSRFAPTKDLATQQELKEDYANLSVKPYGREDLAISLVVPKDWRDIPLSVPTELLNKATEIFVPLTEQRAPKGEAGNALIEARYTQLDMEIALRDLVDEFLESTGYEVLLRREGSYNERQVDEVLARTAQDGQNYLARLTFSRHGDRVFLVNCSVEEAYIRRYAKIFGIAAVSLTVRQESASEFAQPMSEFSSRGEPGLRFRHPAPYWNVEELAGYPEGVTAVTLTLQVPGDTPEEQTTYASIFVEAREKVDKSSPEQSLESLKEVFEAAGFTLKARLLTTDLEPRLEAPLGKLQRWDAEVGGLPAEVSFLLLPQDQTDLALGLFTMKRDDNRYAWMTAWRTFEIVVSDLTGKTQTFYPVRKLVTPSEQVLHRMIAETLMDFAIAVNREDFSDFHSKLAQVFRDQVTPKELYRGFRGFAGVHLEPALFNQNSPTLTGPAYVEPDGVLTLEGYYLTGAVRSEFKLSYFHEGTAWKLLGIEFSRHGARTDSPSPPATEKAGAEEPGSMEEVGSGINVLASSNGGRALYATSQYSEQWGVKNLIDGELGEGHQYASSNDSRQEIVFEMPQAAAVSALLINPSTTESSRQWVREGELWGSTTSPYNDFEKITDFALDAEPVEQSYSFDPKLVRWVRLVLKSNHGGPLFELGEVKLIGRYADEGPTDVALVNVLAAQNGGKVVSFSRQYNDSSWAARNLIDGKLGQGHGFAMAGAEPGEVNFALPTEATIAYVAFNPFTTESPNTWVKDVEVLVSSEGTEGEFTSVGRFTVHNWRHIDAASKPLPDQRFAIEPVKARFIKLRLLSNHGGDYIELGEFKAYQGSQ